MKGLLLKDLYALKKQAKVILAMAAFYVFYAVIMKNFSMLASMIVVVCAILPITTISYDEFCHWDRYMLSTPVSRRTAVLSKYVFAVLLDLAGVALVMAVGAVIRLFSDVVSSREVFAVPLGVGAAALIFISVILPVIFRFGVEKGRLFMMAMIFLPVMLIVLLSRSGLTLLPDEIQIKTVACAGAAVIAVLMFISIRLSVHIYNNKEF